MPFPYDYSSISGYARARPDWVSWPDTSTRIRQGDLDRWDQALFDLKALGANVRDFGATGDGTTNDKAAIQAALDASRFVIVPPGTYRFNTQLSIPAYTTMLLLPGAILKCFVTGGGNAILLGNGSSLSGMGKGGEQAKILVASTANILNVVTNASHTGSQEFGYVEGIFFHSESGAVIAAAAVNFTGLFVNSGIRDCVVYGEDRFTNGYILRGSSGPTTYGLAPVYMKDCWVVSTLQHGIIIDEDSGGWGAVEVWLENITSEFPGDGYHSLFIHGLSSGGPDVDFGIKHVSIKNFHHENRRTNTTTSCGIAIQANTMAPVIEMDGIYVSCTPTANKVGVYIDATTISDFISIRGLWNPSGMVAINDAYTGYFTLEKKIGQYGPAPRIFRGAGSPESVITAPVGSMYLRTDGSTSTTLYIKTSGTGNTGWTAK